MLGHVPIRLKLLFLAGVPVIGALILALHGVQATQRQAATVQALGSIEDLATLSAQMNAVVHELGAERSLAALNHGAPRSSNDPLERQYATTDQAVSTLEKFLIGRTVGELPPRLGQELLEARSGIEELKQFRKAAGEAGLLELLRYYDAPTHHLINATAALAHLSDDGQMLRSVTALVSVLQAKERLSQQQAVLGNVFATKEFPPGSYRRLVQLVTEEQDYVAALELNAPDELMELYHRSTRIAEVAQANGMRQKALDATEDELAVDPALWFRTQGVRISRLRELEASLLSKIRAAATEKIQAAKTSARLYYGLSASILIISIFLTTVVARGISRSVVNLTKTAADVQRSQDFTLRAVKASSDELGTFTETFNEMLEGIQTRDVELARHREQLEELVEDRTRELQQRTRAMRLVLDNVDQGLTTLGAEGNPSNERSTAFDAMLEAPDGLRPFWTHLARDNRALGEHFAVAWEQFREGVIPTELALAQLPTRVTFGDRVLALAYKPIDDGLAGVLLIVSDITAELQSLKKEAEQRELIAVVERLLNDRPGLVEFLSEGEQLVQAITALRADRAEALRALHTIKGNCGAFGVRSVEALAHRIEGSLVDEQRDLKSDERMALSQAWESLAVRLKRLLGETEQSKIEISRAEFSELADAVRRRTGQDELTKLVERLVHEPVAVRFRRMADQIRALAQRTGKDPIDVEIRANGVRIPSGAWSQVWLALAHVVRNAVDHGVEAPGQRRAVGKPPHATIRLESREVDGRVVVEMSDDGCGIDWDRVRELAKASGLPYSTEADLEAALFADGLTTKSHASEISGRGIGLSAVREAVSAVNGSIHVASKRGVGTTVRFEVPLEAAVRRDSAIVAAS
jgi:two-component system, chemotaxis family, sensor kinase CheA